MAGPNFRPGFRYHPIDTTTLYPLIPLYTRYDEPVYSYALGKIIGVWVWIGFSDNDIPR